MFEFSTSVNISLPSFYSAQNPSSLSTGSWPSLLASTHDQNSLYQSCPGTFLPQLQFTEHSQGAELRALAVLNSPTSRKGRSYIICTVTCLRPQSSQWKVAELTTATHYHPSSPSFVTSGHPLQTLTQEVVPGTQHPHRLTTKQEDITQLSPSTLSQHGSQRIYYSRPHQVTPMPEAAH